MAIDRDDHGDRGVEILISVRMVLLKRIGLIVSVIWLADSRIPALYRAFLQV